MSVIRISNKEARGREEGLTLSDYVPSLLLGAEPFSIFTVNLDSLGYLNFLQPMPKKFKLQNMTLVPSSLLHVLE